jgi:hypothetical protein
MKIKTFIGITIFLLSLASIINGYSKESSGFLHLEASDCFIDPNLFNIPITRYYASDNPANGWQFENQLTATVFIHISSTSNRWEIESPCQTSGDITTVIGNIPFDITGVKIKKANGVTYYFSERTEEERTITGDNDITCQLLVQKFMVSSIENQNNQSLKMIYQAEYPFLKKIIPHYPKITSGNTTALSFNKHLKSITDSQQQQATFFYQNNLLNRIIYLNHELVYRYDDKARLIQVVKDQKNLVRYTYFPDASGRLNTIETPSSSMTFVYDPQGRQIKQDSLQISYSNLGDIQSITFPDSKTIQYSYTPFHEISAILYQDQTVASYSYNEKTGLIQSIRFKNGYQAIYNDRLSGSITLLSPTSSVLWTYAPLPKTSQLKSVALQRDINDKVLQKTVSFNQQTIVYDYLYSDRQLSKIWKNSLPWISYSYNLIGNPIERNVSPDISTHYIWNIDNTLLQETKASSSYTVRYIRNAGQPVAMVRPDIMGVSQWTYFINDQFGTPLILIDETGRIISKIHLDSFGSLFPDLIGSRKEIEFRGAKRDPISGLYWLNHQFYDPDSVSY